MCWCLQTPNPVQAVSGSNGSAGIAPRPAGRGVVLAGSEAAATLGGAIGHVVPGPVHPRPAAWGSVSAIFECSGTGVEIRPAVGACGEPVRDDSGGRVGLRGSRLVGISA